MKGLARHVKKNLKYHSTLQFRSRQNQCHHDCEEIFSNFGNLKFLHDQITQLKQKKLYFLQLGKRIFCKFFRGFPIVRNSSRYRSNYYFQIWRLEKCSHYLAFIEYYEQSKPTKRLSFFATFPNSVSNFDETNVLQISVHITLFA